MKKLWESSKWLIICMILLIILLVGILIKKDQEKIKEKNSIPALFMTIEEI